MAKIFIFLSVLSFFINAQANDDLKITRSIDLLNSDHVPLYDCDIYRSQQAYDDCQELKKELYQRPRWSDEGYAIRCSKFIGSKKQLCWDLANHVLNDENPIKCYSKYVSSGTQRERCNLVEQAYKTGQFQSTSSDCFDCYNDDRSEPEPISGCFEIVEQSSEYNRCYKNAYNSWDQMKTSQSEEGKQNMRTGAAVAIAGQIFKGVTRNTNAEQFGHVTGDMATAFGLTLAGYGLYQWTSANMRPPYETPECRKHYTVSRPRTVVINQQQCVTTRYYSRSWNRESYYFQTVCQSQTFYSFEANSQIWY